MSRLGLHGRLPMTMGGGKPRAQRMYEAMVASRGEGRYSKDPNADVNVHVLADARVLDGAARSVERAALNGFPDSATDLLVDWERGLGRFPDPTETEGQRRDMLGAILAGNGEPSSLNILDVLGKILPGEPVALMVSRARNLTFAAATAIALPTVSVQSSPAGAFGKGDYQVSFAFESAAGVVTASSNWVTATNAAAGSACSLLVGPTPLSLVAGAERVHVYLSVAANSPLRAWVATTRGEAVRLDRFPEPPDARELPLYHYAVQVQKSTWDDRVKRGKIDQVLGPMLPGHATYDVITGSPFVLGVNSGSELGRGGL